MRSLLPILLYSLSPDESPDMSRSPKSVEGLLDIQAALDSPEAAEVKRFMAKLQRKNVKELSKKSNFIDNYVHGTRVAGIALKGNPFARLLVIDV